MIKEIVYRAVLKLKMDNVPQTKKQQTNRNKKKDVYTSKGARMIERNQNRGLERKKKNI
jgi:hypothetical protein